MAVRRRPTRRSGSMPTSSVPVLWVGVYQPAFKLPADVSTSTGEGLWRVSLFRGASSGQARAAVARSGATIVRSDPAGLLILADGEQLQGIAHVIEVEPAERSDQDDPFTLEVR